MNKTVLLVWCGLSVLLLQGCNQKAGKSYPINVLTTNIRCSVPSDGINYWDNRKEWLTDCINFMEPDVFGAQEVTSQQLKDMLQMMPSYNYIGLARDKSPASEFSPVFYRKDKFELLEHLTFWLSDHIDSVGYKGWDAACPRIVSWAKLKDKTSGLEFYFFNTHFDHIGEVARTESAKLIAKKVKEIVGDKPFFIVGDLNTTPNSEAYAILNAKFKDSYETAKKKYGPKYTFNGFLIEPDASRQRIDYIFTSKGIETLKHYVIDGQRGSKYLSDHFPILATALIKY